MTERAELFSRMRLLARASASGVAGLPELAARSRMAARMEEAAQHF